MNILEVIQRQAVPTPWVEGEKIPWDDPEFSQRMLAEHLSPAHDAAGWRFEIIDRHVACIHHSLLSGKPATTGSNGRNVMSAFMRPWGG